MSAPFQVLANCHHCLVEGAVVETIVASEDSDASKVVEAHCRLCNWYIVAGEERAAPAMIHDPDAAIHALTSWASREGESDVELFCQSNFGGRSARQVADQIVSRQRVSSSFDVMAWLFGGGMPMGAADHPDAPPPPPPATETEAVDNHDPHRSGRIAARALYSVMIGDGQIRDEERAFVDQCMQYFGAPPLAHSDMRHWLPHEMGIPDDPFPLVEALARLAFIDRERDESEWRIVREFARAWGYPMDKLDALRDQLEREFLTQAWRFWTDLRSFLVRER